VDSTQVRLRPPRHRVSRRAIAYWAVRALTGWLVLLAGQALWALLDHGRGRWHAGALIATLVLAAAHVAVMPQWRFRVHRWEATADAVYTQSGWFNQERRVAPVSRIQTVDSSRGPFEQVFGLADVTVTTASAAGPLKIHGLDHETAQWLADRLTAGTGADPSDAT
jgi:uncharacterized protein